MPALELTCLSFFHERSSPARACAASSLLSPLRGPASPTRSAPPPRGSKRTLQEDCSGSESWLPSPPSKPWNASEEVESFSPQLPPDLGAPAASSPSFLCSKRTAWVKSAVWLSWQPFPPCSWKRVPSGGSSSSQRLPLDLVGQPGSQPSPPGYVHSWLLWLQRAQLWQFCSRNKSVRALSCVRSSWPSPPLDLAVSLRCGLVPPSSKCWWTQISRNSSICDQLQHASFPAFGGALAPAGHLPGGIPCSGPR
mmetsp:Transcript_7218/g.11454  ORF Transcript_7218/g.11454 Transcript_7218/m.11454 type:complete len:252 (-) Transcript_7218:253-1008(-)